MEYIFRTAGNSARFIVGFVFMLLAAIVPTAAQAADAAAEAIEGAWIVSVGSSPRDRFLIVSGAKTSQDRISVETAQYGWIDGKGNPVKDWNAVIVGDELRLRFVSPADSKISASFRMDETTTSGSLVSKEGKTYYVRMTRIPPEELSELRASAKKAAKAEKAPPAQIHAAPSSKIYLLYVGANDCPSCRGYEIEYFGRKELMAKVIWCWQ